MPHIFSGETILYILINSFSHEIIIFYFIGPDVSGIHKWVVFFFLFVNQNGCVFYLFVNQNVQTLLYIISMAGRVIVLIMLCQFISDIHLDDMALIVIID